SALPPLLYFFTESFLMALLAMVLFNANRIMSVAYYLVMTEDAEDEGKIVAFNLFNAITVIAGLLLPIGGLIVGRYGLVPAENAFLLISFAVMTVMILIRHRLLKETAVGERVREKARAEKTGFLPLLISLWKPYRDAIRFLLENRVARAVMLANVFYCVYMNLGTNYSLYFVPYFADRLGMNTMQSSVLGSVYYGGMLAAMIFINPLFGRGSIIRGIVISCGVSLAGMAMMVGIPGGMFVPAVMATLVLAVGYGMLKSSADGAMAVYSESEFRSGIYSTANLLSSGIGVIVTAVCAALYARFAGWLYILCGIMVLLVMLCALRVRGLEKEESTQKE
ncbi:MAG: MFS transporter, partial [Lachnospiraceae bacterium]|nr:MFS transporter [Lachnospiraceae bacterium]